MWHYGLYAKEGGERRREKEAEVRRSSRRKLASARQRSHDGLASVAWQRLELEVEGGK